MSLQQWHKNGWLRPYETSRKQIADLFDIVERDLADAGTARLSSDWQFGIVYNAALKLCTILLYAEGFRPDRGLAHFRTLQALLLYSVTERKPMPNISTAAASNATPSNTTRQAAPAPRKPPN